MGTTYIENTGDPVGNEVQDGVIRTAFKLVRLSFVTKSHPQGLELMDAVASLEITYDYDSDAVFPTLVARLDLTTKEMAEVQHEGDDCRVILRVEMWPDTSSENSPDRQESRERPPTLPFITDVAFKIVEGIPRMPLPRHIDAAKPGKEADSMRIHPCHLGMMAEDHLTMSRKQFSEVFSGSIAEAMHYVLQEVYNGRQKFLVATPDNRKVYEQISLKDGNAREWLDWLHKAYGIYERGMRLFFDFDRGYVLSRDTSKSVFEKGEYEALHFTIVDPADHPADVHGGVVDDKDKKRWLVRLDSGSVTATRLGFGGAEAAGGKALIRSNDPEAGTAAATVAAGEDGGGRKASDFGQSAEAISNPTKKTLPLYNAYGGNPYAETSHAENVRETDATISLMVEAVDPRIMSYNKRVFVKFTNPASGRQFDGEYRLSFVKVLLQAPGSKAGGELLTSYVAASMKRSATVQPSGGSDFKSPLA
jgi:hypothetical protein